MNIDVLARMDDGAFDDAVMQAFKRRDDFPEWWRAVLHPDLIDDTEESLRRTLGRAEGQAADPSRYPQAAGFVLKIRRNALPEVMLARACMED